MLFNRKDLRWSLIYLCSVLLNLHPFNTSASELGVLTFNLRGPEDPPPNDWQSRKPRIISIIHYQQPDFIGVQEVTPTMINDLHAELPGYAVIGRGREADSSGEATQVLFLKSRWELDKYDQGTLQLSPTPEVIGSNGWGMRFPRIFTWVHLREKKTGKFIYVFNTHFPLTPPERNLSVQLLANEIAQRKHKQDPVILTGDFNACEDETAMQYILGEGGSPIAMSDTYRPLHPNDKTGTFHAFGTTQSCKIDYIYTLGKLQALDSNILAEHENFASDHFAVSARLHF